MAAMSDEADVDAGVWSCIVGVNNVLRFLVSHFFTSLPRVLHNNLYTRWTTWACVTVTFLNHFCCVRRVCLSIQETCLLALPTRLALWNHAVRGVLSHCWRTFQRQIVAKNGKGEEWIPGVSQTWSHMRLILVPSPSIVRPLCLFLHPAPWSPLLQSLFPCRRKLHKRKMCRSFLCRTRGWLIQKTRCRRSPYFRQLWECIVQMCHRTRRISWTLSRRSMAERLRTWSTWSPSTPGVT